MLSIDTKLYQRSYQLRKVKVIEVFFVEIQSEFYRNSTLKTQRKVCLPSPSGIYKKYTCLPIFLQFFCQIIVVICSVHQGSSLYLLNLHFFIRYFQLSLLLNLTLVHQIFSEHSTSRNCYSDPSNSFRTSYFQKLLLQSIKQFQDILLPEIITPIHQIFSGHLTSRTYYYYIYSITLMFNL